MTQTRLGEFHDFHQTWTVQIKTVLNTGLLPKNFTALVELKADEGELRLSTTEMVFRTDEQLYSDRANRIVIKHHMGRTVAVIELVSPGNKNSQHKIQDFVKKVVEFISNGVHVLIVDLFPPTPRDPQGIHELIWNELKDQEFTLPAERNLILAAYEAGPEKVAYVQPVAVGATLPTMPLFLAIGKHIPLPLEKTYQMAWATCTEELRTIVETGDLPEMEEDDAED